MENLPDFESKLQAENISLQGDIAILEEKNVQCIQHNKSLRSMSNEEFIKTFNIISAKWKKP